MIIILLPLSCFTAWLISGVALDGWLLKGTWKKPTTGWNGASYLLFFGSLVFLLIGFNVCINVFPLLVSPYY